MRRSVVCGGAALGSVAAAAAAPLLRLRSLRIGGPRGTFLRQVGYRGARRMRRMWAQQRGEGDGQHEPARVLARSCLGCDGLGSTAVEAGGREGGSESRHRMLCFPLDAAGSSTSASARVFEDGPGRPSGRGAAQPLAGRGGGQRVTRLQL
eukprot:354565-Chlamydomonas_euryale.AAC.11